MTAEVDKKLEAIICAVTTPVRPGQPFVYDPAVGLYETVCALVRQECLIAGVRVTRREVYEGVAAFVSAAEAELPV